MKKASIWLVGLIVIGVCIPSAFFIGNYYSGCRGLSCIDFTGKENLKLQDEYEKKGNAYRALFRQGTGMVRVESYADVIPSRADELSTYKTMQLQSMYETVRSPYPGSLSDRITCEERLKVQFRESADGTAYFTGFLNDRLQYGGCTEDQTVYQGIGIMKYCPNRKTWYLLEFISPKNDGLSSLQTLLKSIRCL